MLDKKCNIFLSKYHNLHEVQEGATYAPRRPIYLLWIDIFDLNLARKALIKARCGSQAKIDVVCQNRKCNDGHKSSPTIWFELGWVSKVGETKVGGRGGRPLFVFKKSKHSWFLLPEGEKCLSRLLKIIKIKHYKAIIFLTLWNIEIFFRSLKDFS